MKKVKGLGLILYGKEGMGKTSLALRFSVLGPLTCLSVGDVGYEDLAILGEVPENSVNHKITKFDQLMTRIKAVEEGVLVIDSWSGVERLLFDHVCRMEFKGNKDEFTSYWKGQRINSPPYMVELLDLLEMARNRGVHVITIGHSIVERVPNTMGADYIAHALKLDEGDKGGIRSCVKEWAQAILFMTVDIEISRVTEKEKGLVLEGKASDEDRRVMWTSLSPTHSAKNKLNLPPVIFLGNSAKEAFKNLWAKMPEVYRNLTA